MPKSKTIEIDEIVAGDETSSTKAGPTRSGQDTVDPSPDHSDIFSELKKSLGWKTRATIWATQKFIHLRSKPWGNWVLVPLTLLGILLAIPLGIIFAIVIFFRTVIRSFNSPR